MPSTAQEFEPQPGDLVDLGQGGGEFRCRIIADPRGEGSQNVGPLKAPHRDDERVAEAGAIAVIQLRKPGKFVRCAAVEPGPGLLGTRLRRQRASDGQPAGKFRMRAKQRQLAARAGTVDNFAHACSEVRQLTVIGAKSLIPDRFGDPGRVFVYAAELRHEFSLFQTVRRYRELMIRHGDLSAFRMKFVIFQARILVKFVCVFNV